MKYTCYNKSARRKSEQMWVGEIRSFQFVDNHYEMDVVGRGSSFYIIFGESCNGKYICIPNWGVGCPLASYHDIFWNQERLAVPLGDVDAITVATAIKEAKVLIKNYLKKAI